jgi:hypothetical protein
MKGLKIHGSILHSEERKVVLYSRWGGEGRRERGVRDPHSATTTIGRRPNLRQLIYPSTSLTELTILAFRAVKKQGRPADYGASRVGAPLGLTLSLPIISTHRTATGHTKRLPHRCTCISGSKASRRSCSAASARGRPRTSSQPSASRANVSIGSVYVSTSARHYSTDCPSFIGTVTHGSGASPWG